MIYNADAMSETSETSAATQEELLQELLALQKDMEAQKQIQLDAIGVIIRGKLDDAVKAREESGIERQWAEDEEYEAGIDEYNRDTTLWRKSRTSTGGLVKESRKVDDTECTEFFNITRPFCRAATSRMTDMLLPANDWPFRAKPTSIPELPGRTDTIVDPSTGAPFADPTIALEQESSERAERANKRITDWLTETDYKAEMRKVLEDAVTMGSGVLKGPFPDTKKTVTFENGEVVVTNSTQPHSKRVNYWDFFPARGCGEEIQKSDHVFERDYLSASKLAELRDFEESGYIKTAIDKVLEQGPGKTNDYHHNRRKTSKEDFEVWYFHGEIKKVDLKALDDSFAEQCECDEEEDKYGTVSAILVMVNDTVIKGVLNPMEHAGHPYDIFCWKKTKGAPFGEGIARDGRVAQKTVLYAFRKLMKNMGLASVPMLAFQKGALEPVDKNWRIYGGKSFFIRPESGVKDAREAIQSIIIPSMQTELVGLLQLGIKMMEDSTGIKFLMQGDQGGAGAADKVGGMLLMLQNSSSILRDAVGNFDVAVASHLKRYNHWLQIHGDDADKGDIHIEAIGSSILIERDAQAQQLPVMLQFAANPLLGKSQKKIFAQWMKMYKFDPESFEIDEEEQTMMQQMQEAQQATQAQDPRIEIATMNAEKDKAIAEQRSQVALMKIQKDTDRDALYAAGVAERNRVSYQSHVEELNVRRDLAMLEYANQNKMQIDEIKAKLADSAMRLSVQRELADMGGTPRQVIAPPSEPPQRAPDGEAFQQ